MIVYSIDTFKKHELSYLDRPPVGYFGNEHANKGAPGDPPAPVEYGPAVHPLKQNNRK
jgi:hypothetical protein